MSDPTKRKSPFINQNGEDLIATAILGLTRLYGVAENGEVSANSVEMNFDRFYHPVMAKPPHLMSTELQLGNGTLVLDAGAACVLGMPDKGKTLFATTLAARNPKDVSVIRFREPENDSLLNEASFVNALHLALASPATVIFVDSLRTTFYTTSGSTGKGGVNMGIFALLTAFDILARRAGKIVLFALNPMTNDGDAIEFYLDAARGSVSHTFHATEPKKLRLSSRSGRGRSWTDVKYVPPSSKEQSDLLSSKAIPVTESRSATLVDLYTISL